MTARKTPYPDSPEGRIFCQEWDRSTHYGKVELCIKCGFPYGLGKKFRQACKKYELPPKEKFPKDIPWAEQIQIIKQMDSLVAIHQRVPTEITVEIPTDKPIGLCNTADWHLGMFGVDYDSFERDIDLIESEPGLYCAIGGDGYHNIIQSSKIGSSHNQQPINVQKGLYYLTVKRLREKIAYIGTGNHNYWSALAEGEDWDRELANRLKLVYTKHSGIINLVVGDMLYPILRMHKGRFQSSFNLTHVCKQYQRMYFPQARVVVVEHDHTANVEQYRYNEQECCAIRTGSYAVYDDWAQQNGFFGAHVDSPTLILYPHEDKMVCFKHLSDAVTHLRAVRGDTLPLVKMNLQ